MEHSNKTFKRFWNIENDKDFRNFSREIEISSNSEKTSVISDTFRRFPAVGKLDLELLIREALLKNKEEMIKF